MSLNAICEIHFERRRVKSCKLRICATVSSNLFSSSLRYSERRSVLRIKMETFVAIVPSVHKREKEASRFNTNSVYAKNESLAKRSFEKSAQAAVGFFATWTEENGKSRPTKG